VIRDKTAAFVVCPWTASTPLSVARDGIRRVGLQLQSKYQCICIPLHLLSFQSRFSSKCCTKRQEHQLVSIFGCLSSRIPSLLTNIRYHVGHAIQPFTPHIHSLRSPSFHKRWTTRQVGRTCGFQW
jgi:hypothetical protein